MEIYLRHACDMPWLGQDRRAYFVGDMHAGYLVTTDFYFASTAKRSLRWGLIQFLLETRDQTAAQEH